MTTLVLGASLNPTRYAYRAIHSLVEAGVPTYALGRKAGTVAGVPVYTDPGQVDGVIFDTITLYLSAVHQHAYLDWILARQPRRVIFNPGTENPPFEQRLSAAGIDVLRACTLVMLQVGTYE